MADLKSLLATAAGYIKEDYAKWAILVVCGGGGIPKLLAAFGMGPMAKEFWKLPSWFWLPCFIWEETAVLALTTDILPKNFATIPNFELGLLLMYSYLSGIIACNVLVHVDVTSVVKCMFCLSFFVVTASLAWHRGIKEPTVNHTYAVPVGFAIGAIIGTVFGRKDKPQKSAKAGSGKTH